MPARHQEPFNLLLLGAGHAHLEVLRRFATQPEPNLRLTLISREPQTPYSGMLPGLIRGDYTHRQAHVDLAPLAAAAQAQLITAEATAIDLAARVVTLRGHAPTRFDLLSLDVGGEPLLPRQFHGSRFEASQCDNHPSVTVVPSTNYGAKPIGRLLGHLRHLEAELAPGSRIAVVGGGAAGTELTLALAIRFAGRFRLVLVCASAEPVALAPALARCVVRRALAEAGVQLVCGVTAIGMHSDRLPLSDGSCLDVATAVWATGAVGPRFLAASGLACDPTGSVRVDAALRSLSHPYVFAAGDCATLEGSPRPKAGVWAVRAGAPLAGNLRRSVRRQSLVSWRPQRDALVILSLGEGRAVGWRNGVAVAGRGMGWLKDHIDRRWMNRYTLP